MLTNDPLMTGPNHNMINKWSISMNVRGQNGLGKTSTLKAQSFRISYDKLHVPSITLIRDKNYTFLIKAFQ